MEKILDIKQVVSRNLIKYRKLNNLTQAQLASKLNYTDKAISKWEQGETIPDVYVLEQIANLYNIKLEDLLHQETTLERVQTFTKNKYVITLLSTLLVWLIGMVCYVLIEIISPSRYPSYLTFIACIPATFIVLVVFNSLWGARIYNMIFTSGINWGVSLFLVQLLSKYSEQMWYLYFVSAIFEILIILWYMLDTKRNSRPKSQVINSSKENQ